jgi:hypothetical protein
MERISLDLLLYVLIFAGILLFNYVRQRLARRSRQAPRPPAAEGVPPSATGWGRAAEAGAEPEARRERVSRTPPVHTAASPEVERPRAPALFRTRAELRRGVIAMTVLGPCRAKDPPDAS